MTAQPVLVLHGVGNRGGEAAFVDHVAALQREVDPDGARMHLVPVYWGDLGGDPDHIDASLPDVTDHAVRTDDEAGTSPDDRALGVSMLGGFAVRSTDGAKVVAGQAQRAHTVRGAEDEVAAAVHEVWPELTTLPHVDDVATLELVGDLLRQELEAAPPPPSGADAPGADPAPRFDTRDEHDVRGVGDALVARVRGVLTRADALVDRVVGRIGGQVNTALRDRFGGQFVGFFGDIIAYSQRRDEVHARLRAVLADQAPGAGTAEQPVGVIAHSLGGVIAFDAAVADVDPLHVSGLVTFGSQAPFFHAMARRSNMLEPYAGTGPVALPDTLGRWVNLWEPLDLLAFVASRIFRLHDGSEPDDRIVAHDAGALWTHSVYWETTELRTAIADVFG